MRGLFIAGLAGFLVALATISVGPFFLSSREMGLIIPVLVLLLMVTRPSRVMTHVLVVGVILDSYALDITYAHTLRLLLLATGGFFISRQWLTNRSLYTALALAGLMTTVDQLWVALAEALQGSGTTIAGFARTSLTAYVLHGLLVIIGFTAITFFSKRLASSMGRGGASDWYV